MKKFLLSLSLTLVFSAIGTSAADIVVSCGSDNWPGKGSYNATIESTKTFADVTWAIQNLNNNNFNNGWTAPRGGSKTATNPTSAYIYSKAAVAIPIASVSVKALRTAKYSATKSKPISMSLMTADNAQFTNATTTTTQEIASTEATDYVFTVATPAKNLYYKIVFDWGEKQNDNGVFEVQSFTLTPAALELGEIMVGEKKANNLTATIYSGEKIKFTCANAVSMCYTAEESAGSDTMTDEAQAAAIEWEAPTVTAATDYFVSITAKDKDNKTTEASMIITVKPARATTSLTFAAETLEHNATEFGAEIDGVALTVTPENAAVKYTSDKPEIVAVDETTGKLTINALGTAIITATVDGTETYSDASASYTVDVNPTKLAQLLSLEKDTPFILKNGNMTIVYQNGAYLYIQDETAGIQVYQNSETYTVGSKFTELSGTYSLFNNLPQVKSSTTGGFTTDEPVAVEPVVRSIDYVTADVMNQYITIENLTISQSGKNYIATDAAGKTITVYNRFNLTMQTGEHITITGLTSCFNTTLQIFPTEFTTYTSPVSIIEGENTLTGDIVLSGSDRTINFTYPGHIEVWYKWEPTATPESVRARVASVDADGFTKHEGEYIVLSTSGTLSYYSVNNGVKSDVSRIGVSGGGTSAISEISAEQNGAEVIYDLQGRRVSRAVKGLFIVNGKKELRK